MKRKSLSRLAKVRIFDRHDGFCDLCHMKIVVGEEWHCDHVKPLWLGGEDVEANMTPVHAECHRVKTTNEHIARAHGDRVRAYHLGIRKKSKRPIPGSKASGWKRKMDGSVVRR